MEIDELFSIIEKDKTKKEKDKINKLKIINKKIPTYFIKKVVGRNLLEKFPIIEKSGLKIIYKKDYFDVFYKIKYNMIKIIRDFYIKKKALEELESPQE